MLVRSRAGRASSLSTVEVPEIGRELAESLLGDFDDIEDAVEAELMAAALLSSMDILLGEDAARFLWESFVPSVESIGGTAAVGMLAAVSALADPAIAEACGLAADRLRAAGCAAPDWAEELAVPSTVHECRALRDKDGDTYALAVRFDRAGSSCAFVLLIEPDHCGAAAEVAFMDGAELAGAVAKIRAIAKSDGLKLVEAKLDPAQLRWEAEVAMDARAEHDLDDREFTDPRDLLAAAEDESPYCSTAPLLRARLRALPLSDKPKPVHDKGFSSPAFLEALSRLGGGGTWSRIRSAAAGGQVQAAETAAST